MAHPQIWKFVALTLFMTLVTRWFTAYAQKCYLRRKHHCKVANHSETYDPLFKSDIFYESCQALKSHTYLSKVEERFRIYGNTFDNSSIRGNIILTCEPTIIKAMLATQFDDFGLGEQRKLAFEPLLGHGLFNAEGEEWKKWRKILRPGFEKGNIANMEIFETHVQRLISRIEMTQQKAYLVDIQPLLYDLTLDVFTSMFFGKPASMTQGGEDDHHNTDFAGAFNRTQRRVWEDSALGSLAKLRSHSQFDADLRTLGQVVDPYVRRAIQSRLRDSDQSQARENQKWSSTLEEITKHCSDESSIRGHILSLLVGGRDTTTSLLSSFWFEVAQRPDIVRNLQEEIRGLEGAMPDFTVLKHMELLQACINETLRLHPPVPVNSRTALRDTVLPLGGGPDGQSPLLITTNTVVEYYVYAMHHRKDIWGQDANDFKPERWKGRKTGWEFLPFNGGPRICLGRKLLQTRSRNAYRYVHSADVGELDVEQLALTEAAYTIVRLLQRYQSVRSVNEKAWTENLGLTCSIEQGTLVRFEGVPGNDGNDDACGIMPY